MKKILRCIVLGVFIGLFLKLFVLDIPQVYGSSMEPAVYSGERILVNKLAYGLDIPFGSSKFVTWKEPDIGDIIVYMHDGDLVLKRCVGKSSMPLEIINDNGYTLLLGGEKIPLTEEQYRLLKNIHSVPEGTVFAVGDNYTASIDSRNYGFIPVRDVLGKVLCR